MSDFLPEKAPYQSRHNNLVPIVLCVGLGVAVLVQYAWRSYREPAPSASIHTSQAADAPSAELLAKAEQGDVEAQYQLGRFYMHRNDWVAAIPWYERAAAQGHAKAQNNAGVAYMEGRGVAVDYDKGCDYLTAAHAQLQTAHSAENVQMCQEEVKKIKGN